MTSARRRYTPPRTVAELVERYQAGERVFPKTSLSDDVIETSLPGIDLQGSKLHLIFNDIDLRGASFANADLNFSHFDADLSMANFESAELAYSSFGGSNLTDVNLRHAELLHTEFESANLLRCDFSSAEFNRTVLLGVSLASLCKSSDIMFEGPCYVDHRTIMKSLRVPLLKEFLLRMGMPAVFAEYMIDCARSLDKDGIFSLLQSTFISYGAPDEPFARRLNAALEARGVPTFFFPKHAPPGARIHRVIREGVNNCDRVILICSMGSLTRKGVLNEIEETLEREARDGGETYLIPIRLDDYVFRGWRPPNADTARSVRARVVADFTGAAGSADAFDTALSRLVSVLKRRPVAPAALSP